MPKIRYVPVPVRLLPAVFTLLATAMTEDTTTEDPTTDDPTTGPDASPAITPAAPAAPAAAPAPPPMSVLVDWTEIDLSVLAGNTNDGVLGLMQTVTENAPEWVPTSAIVAATGLTMPTIRSGNGGLTRHLRAHWGSRPGPFQGLWGPDIDPTFAAEVYFRCTVATAEAWKTARGHTAP
jgi:hypothetical protein